MFRFANIEYLYLLVTIPALVALFFWALYERRQRIARFGEHDAVVKLMPQLSMGSVKFKFLLFLLAYAMVIFAAARPQVGSKLREVKSRGVEMMMVVDVSNSMMAEDFSPNRLENTKFAIERLFRGLGSQQRVGLIAFAGSAQVELPITSDFRMASTFAERLSPTMVAQQGTDIGKALDLALLSFSEQRESSKVVVLITDGEAHDNGAVAAAKRAAEQGVKIFTVGIGTPDGAPITVGGELIRDENGDIVVSQLNEKMLQEIARVTDAGYVRATNQSIGLESVTSTIAAMEQTELATSTFEEYGERYQYFLVVALLLLLINFFITDSRNAALRRFTIFS
ncbi:MAG: VWA domain-containing protein [Rikenellaceae bacterium]